MELNDIVELAIDNHRGRVKKYSASESNEVLRQALVEANNGSTKLDYRAIRDGKCNGLFTLIEVILSTEVIAELQSDDFYNDFVEYRNVAEGDSPVFWAEDYTVFTVASAADGTQSVRRQRLDGGKEVNIPTTFHLVRIYDDMNRALSGRVDFNSMISKVADAFSQKILEEIYTLWVSATSADLGGTAFFPAAGAYDEDTLLELIAHVEAAAGGKTATIIGTKKALRNLKESILSDAAKDDYHNMGYAGKFFGSPVVAIPQRHKIGTTEFVMDDNMLTIVAGDQRPIKFVYEGTPITKFGDPLDNADLTQEYIFGEKFGLGLILAGGNAGIGRYEISA